MHRLVNQEGIGFTDLVKRPTRGAAELRTADYRAGAPRLRTLIETCRPRCAWFHGKLAYENFARHVGLDSGQSRWGRQEPLIGGTWIFVSPNPSPANAAFSLDDLVVWYDRLADLLSRPQP